MEIDDHEAVARTRAGDRDAFRPLVERHSQQVFRLAFRITGDEALAEDAVQESFLAAFRNLDRFDGRCQFGTWLYRIAANQAIEAVRRRRRLRERGEEFEPVPVAAVTDEPGPERRTLAREVGQAAEAALAELSEAEKTAFLLRHHQGCSIAEIGSALGLKENATKQAVFRAVKKLRRALQPWAGASYEHAI